MKIDVNPFTILMCNIKDVESDDYAARVRVCRWLLNQEQLPTTPTNHGKKILKIIIIIINIMQISLSHCLLPTE